MVRELMLLLRLQLHSQRLVHSQGLADTKVEHNFLAATRDGVRSDISVKALDFGALTASAITETTKDLTRLTSTELEGGGGLGLEACDSTTQLQHGLHFVHLLALEDHVFQPGVGRFDLAEHVGELETNHWVIDELLAKGASLVGIFHGLLVADTRKSQALDNDADTLVAMLLSVFH